MMNVRSDGVDRQDDAWRQRTSGSVPHFSNGPKRVCSSDPREGKCADLPEDVWWTIFENLTKAELVGVSSVCHDFKRLCDSDPRWGKFVTKRDITVLDPVTPQKAAFAYCKQYNATCFSVLNSPFSQKKHETVQIPLEVRSNLFSTKKYIGTYSLVSGSPMSLELHRRLDNCGFGAPPLSLQDIHVLLEAGSRLTPDVIERLPLFLAPTENVNVAQEKLNAILDQLWHPGSGGRFTSIDDIIRVMCRWKGRFAAMSPRALSELTMVGKCRICQHESYLQQVPVDFPNYRELVVFVCALEPSAIRFVPKGDFDDYRQLVLDAIEQNEGVFSALSDDLRTSPEFLRQAIMRNGFVLSEYASELEDIPDSTFYRELAMLALRKSGGHGKSSVAREIVWDAIPDYQPFVTSALNMLIEQGELDAVWHLFRKIDPARVDNYQTLVDKAVAACPWSLWAAKKNCIDNYRELLKSALTRNPELFLFALKEDFDLEEYRMYATQAVQVNGWMIFDLDKSRLGPEHYRKLLIVAMGQNGQDLNSPLCKAFREDIEVVATAVKQNPRAITSACDEFKRDLTPLLRTCATYKEAEELFLARWYLPQELDRNSVDAGFALIAQMAAQEEGCPKGEVERLLDRIRDSTLRETVRWTLDSVVTC